MTQKDKIKEENKSPLSPNEKRKIKVVVPGAKSETKKNESPTKTPATPGKKLPNKLNKTTDMVSSKATYSDKKTTRKSPNSGILTILDDDLSQDSDNSEEEKKVPAVFTLMPKR